MLNFDLLLDPAELSTFSASRNPSLVELFNSLGVVVKCRINSDAELESVISGLLKHWGAFTQFKFKCSDLEVATTTSQSMSSNTICFVEKNAQGEIGRFFEHLVQIELGTQLGELLCEGRTDFVGLAIHKLRQRFVELCEHVHYSLIAMRSMPGATNDLMFSQCRERVTASMKSFHDFDYATLKDVCDRLGLERLPKRPYGERPGTAANQSPENQAWIEYDKSMARALDIEDKTVKNVWDVRGRELKSQKHFSSKDEFANWHKTTKKRLESKKNQK